LLNYALTAEVVGGIKERMQDALDNPANLNRLNRDVVCVGDACVALTQAERRLLFKHKPFERECVFAEAHLPE
jgi:hypothetical protein